MIKDNWICSLSEVVIKGPDVVIVEKIKNSRDKDKEVVKVVKQMKKTKVRELWEEEWKIERDLVLKEEKIYVLRDEKLKVEIIWLYHNVLAARHKEKRKTIELVTRNYWWPGIMKDIGRYIEGCDICQRMKNRTVIIIASLI